MDALRIILIIVGVVVVAGIYLWGRRRDRSADVQNDSPDDSPFDWEAGDFSAERTPGLDADGLDRLSGLRVDNDPISEAVARQSAPRVEEAFTPAPASPSEPASEEKAHSRTEPVREKLTAPVKALKEAVTASVSNHLGARESAAHEASERPVPPPMLVVLNVLAPKGRAFTGTSLLEAMAAAGLKHGEMGIFHYHAQPEGGEAIFSVANLLEPGRFDVDNMVGFSTPGVAMFMRLPGPMDGLEAVEKMIEAGHVLANQLGGELCDETRSVLSVQTETHLRDRIKEYQRQTKLSRVEH